MISAVTAETPAFKTGRFSWDYWKKRYASLLLNPDHVVFYLCRKKMKYSYLSVAAMLFSLSLPSHRHKFFCLCEVITNQTAGLWLQIVSLYMGVLKTMQMDGRSLAGRHQIVFMRHANA